MGYRTELLLGCIGLNLITDIILWTYGMYSPKHIGLRIVIYVAALLFAWLSESEPLKCFKWLLELLRNSRADGRHRHIHSLISGGEIRGKAKVIRFAAYRGQR